MKRTKLADRVLPSYTKGEEVFNMVSHIIGGAFGVVYLVLCVIFAAVHGNPWGVVGSAIYGASVTALFTMSSIYHGLRPEKAKKVLQVIDHCTIYFMIAGTYTPFTLCTIREIDPVIGWGVFGVIWGMAALAVTLTAIDLKKYSIFSMICYLGMGWCVVFTAVPLFRALGFWGSFLLLGGGIMYTVGAVLYGLGKKKRYVHSLFHMFVVLASLMHFFCIFFYVI
ncbi:MAG: hemolysin III family protein [Clostridia bacterium]|nr:hemolysin III family protein [Clostridia bacterium]